MKRLYLLPTHMIQAVENWILRGQPHPDLLGHFLRAVLLHDLMESYKRADDENMAAMKDWVLFLYNDAPAPCHGSKEALLAWHQRGGLDGIENAVVPDLTIDEEGDF